MIKPFEFYFDFASPYSFLAHKKIREIEKVNSIKIKYMPIFLGGIFKLAGNKANIDIPTKGKYMIKDCKLWAEKYNITFKFNNYFPIDTLSLMRCAIVAQNKGFEQNFINKVFDAIWKDGLNLNDNVIVEKLLKNLEINPKTFLIESIDIKIKETLKKETDNAFEKGIFGAPSFIVNNKIFWGQDRLEFVINESKKN
jgi:2-hydroxychromene-2-carboxylate isomerase